MQGEEDKEGKKKGIQIQSSEREKRDGREFEIEGEIGREVREEKWGRKSRSKKKEEEPGWLSGQNLVDTGFLL